MRDYARTARAWELSCGDVIARMTTVQKLKAGVLEVAVHDSNWVTELNFLKGEFLERIKEKGVAANSLKFFYKQKPAPEAFKDIPKKSMSQREKQYADALADTIENATLRDSFRKAMYSYFTVYSLDDKHNS
jgi:predicted nucleic acid-binding Zn ribbon protein